MLSGSRESVRWEQGLRNTTAELKKVFLTSNSHTNTRKIALELDILHE